MRGRKVPLQISIFVLLFVFTLTGQLVQGRAFQLREGLPLPTAASPVQTLASTAKQTKQISGEVISVTNNALFIGSDNKILRFSLPSNAFVFKNGAEAAATGLSQKDHVVVTASENGTAMRVSAISQPIITGLKIALFVSAIAITFFLSGVIFRKTRAMLQQVARENQHHQRVRNQLSLR